MEGLSMTNSKSTERKPGAAKPVPMDILTREEFAALGTGVVAYVKAMTSDEVKRLYPEAPELAPGLDLFALLSADGSPILLTNSRDAATANAWEHDLAMVSLH
jgi:hypothetical protein